MKVLYDYQALMLQKYGGVSRYFYELIAQLKKDNKDYEAIMSGVFSRNAYFSDTIPCTPLYGAFRGFNRILNLINDLTAAKDVLFGRCDVAHITYYESDLIVLLKKLMPKKVRLVVTVHDMTHELLLNETTTKGYKTAVRRKKKAILAADQLICISENTKKDLLEIYPDVREEKISIIYHGFSAFNMDEPIRTQFPERYILFVGQRAGYKNFTTYVKTMEKLMNEDESLYAVCAGGGAFGENELDMPERLKKRFLQFSLNDTELAEAYRRAIAFVYPSLYEGFGIPILEAYSCDCPVVLSDTSCFPEIAGNAAAYFDGKDIQALAEILRRFMYSAEMREQLIRKGRERLKEFTWENAAHKTNAVYKRALK